MRALLTVLLLLAAGAGGAQAHDLQYRVTQGEAVVVSLFFADDTRFGFEDYTIYRAGAVAPYQEGRTDGRGRIAFLPDGAGEWRIKVISPAGHGLDLRLTTGAAGALAGADRPFYERHARIVIGVALLLGVFGVVMLFMRGRKRGGGQ